jgi:hypothetical protein
VLAKTGVGDDPYAFFTNVVIRCQPSPPDDCSALAVGARGDIMMSQSLRFEIFRAAVGHDHAAAGGSSLSGARPRGVGAPPDILLAQGDTLPNSTAVVLSFSRPIAGADGDFAVVTTNMGRSLVRFTAEGTAVPILGVGASGERASFSPRSYVVNAGRVAVDAGEAIVAAPVADSSGVTTIIRNGDSFAGAAVTEIFTLDTVYLNGARNGTGRVVTNGSTDIVISFNTETGVPSPLLTELTQAPGFPAGVNLLNFTSGTRINSAGFTGTGARLFGSGISSANDEIALVLDAGGNRVALVQEGTQVPGAAPGTVFTLPAAPVLGSTGAAVLHRQRASEESMPRALGFVDLAGNFRTIAMAGQAAPGGGVFDDLLVEFAMSPAGVLVFRGRLAGGATAYYAVDTTSPQATPVRLIGTGSLVPLPEGGMAAVTGTTTIPVTGGQSGEPTALSDTYLVLTVGLGNQQSAVVSVDLEDFL